MPRQPKAHSAEIELKLSLPGATAQGIGAQLAALPQLAGLAVVTQRLRNIYFDTPGQQLRQHKVALRLRSLREGGGRPRWLQTLKTAGQGEAGLSARGEWEVALRKGAIDALALQGTPWPQIDPDGSLLRQLLPCFTTECTRTLREYSAPDGSLVEVALDVGSVRAGAQREPLCELELELKHGSPQALFALAAQLAEHLPVLPAPQSKAERGWRLVDGTSHAPRRARQPMLAARTPLPQAAQAVLAEALGQFVENLDAILHSDGPELVHQARVGWRRWRSALWLFKPLLANIAPAPDCTALRPLLIALGALRDLDVAALESLPCWSEAYVAGHEDRAAHWQAMEAAVAAERRRRRQQLLAALRQPATGQMLLALAQWLYALPDTRWPPELARQGIARWALRRTRRLHGRLREALAALEKAEPADGDPFEQQHSVRLLAKRTRYVLEALRTVLPRERTRRWQDRATDLQTRIGAARDLMLLAELLAPLGVHPGILGFVRGVAAAHGADH